MTGVEGRAFFVTGGASGIGLAVARLALQRGAKVCVVDRDGDALMRAAQALGSDAQAVACDVADAARVNEAVALAAARLGRLDAVVNAAGVDHLTPLDRIADEDWARTLAVNLTGPMLVCRAAVPHLRRAGGGTIVNVASAAGLVPLPGRSAYCATKAGVIMFGKALAMELAADGIRVNAVCPGAVDTPLLRTSYEDADDASAALEAIRQRYALRRVARPEELAEAVLYLSSPASSYVTGTAHAVDGGRSFH
ncbi:NADP-dependent 3-hydroxy acid dehydrogenase YdfG [Variovorax sp. HW608]|uniref:SDR family NAD(P)-dependent oxidoreductase n=1 Tax=Variovorax sp. HW608 TaxID=1034889 RepID=UPI0008200EBF|nr:SDR family oxidoreductase [Variovorax sp. HW608]SCK24960.1 NADP-dependent 3-hydroxy acid dehydrogenase YdfG [Variovorax sp. HW608]